MNHARDSILDRLEQALGKGAQDEARLTERLRAAPGGPKPVVAGDLLEHFAARARALGSEVVRCARQDDVPGAVAAYLAHHNLSRTAVCWPEYASWPWHLAGISVHSRAAAADDLLGITGVFCAVAETGTLVTLSGPATPPSVSLLPETHVAIVDASRVVAHYEEAWAQLRAGGQTPRAVNFISGPSRTADIEQAITLGAHGPYRVLIVLVTGA
jgi:L-lactate dehydrogenase complex protein LldG